MTYPAPQHPEVLDYATPRPPPPRESRGIGGHLLGWLLVLAIAAAAILVLCWIDRALSWSIGG